MKVSGESKRLITNSRTMEISIMGRYSISRHMWLNLVDFMDIVIGDNRRNIMFKGTNAEIMFENFLW